jgi:hypothetical protein
MCMIKILFKLLNKKLKPGFLKDYLSPQKSCSLVISNNSFLYMVHNILSVFYLHHLMKVNVVVLYFLSCIRFLCYFDLGLKKLFFFIEWFQI